MHGKPSHVEQGPLLEGRLTRQRIPRTNDYQQAAERWHTMEAWERDELVAVLTGMISEAATHVQERMVWHFLLVDEDYGQRVADGLGVSLDNVAALAPLETQTLGETDLARVAALPNPGKRTLSTRQVTGSVAVGQGLPTSAGAPS